MTDASTIERIRKLRRMQFSLQGIAKQTGLSEAEVAKVLQEPHLLAQISRSGGKSVLGRG